MNDNAHIIQKQFVELSLPHGADSFALSQRIERLLQEPLYRKLEPVFDRLAGAGRWIELDTLEIDLGELYIGQDDEQWLEQACHRFSEALESVVALSTQTKTGDSQQYRTDCLAYFLAHGHLPWWAGEIDLEKLMEAQIRQQPEAVLALFKPPATSSAAASTASSTTLSTQLHRWILQFPARLHHALLEALSIRLSIALKDWQDSVTMLSRQQAAVVYWQTTWQWVLQHGSLSDQQAWQSQLLHNLFAAAANGQPNNRDISNQLQKLNRLLDGFDQVLASEASLREFLTSHPKKAGQSSATVSRHQFSETPDGIYVPLAGAVLVHPFLPALFDRVGLLNGENFKDFAAQERAVHVLYYIATRQQQPLESEAVLLKLLCGLQPETPIARAVELTAGEMQETERMLQALIDHWPAIAGTTPEELRGTFFVREGKLVDNDLGWLLTVEQTGFDILLGKLPWGLSPLQHTWMDRMLWVEWA